MGCGGSIPQHKSSAEDNIQIDVQLPKNYVPSKSEVKLLLLGAGESGKSTIVKQMKIIHCDGYSLEERMQFRPIVYSNVIQSLLSILYVMKKHGIGFGNSSRHEDAELLFSAIQFQDEPQIPCNLGEIIQSLWKDEGVQRCFSHSKKYQFHDSASYFLNEIKRISSPEYAPTDQDILNTRTRTTGIIDTKFVYKNTPFRIVDVGGQRSERLKWLRCFEDVTAIIFCTALSEYDLMLEEDSGTNRMFESMKLYERICNNRLFIITSMIVFFNKIDIFKEKITFTPLTICFPEYGGPNSHEEALAYIKDKFMGLLKEEFRYKKAIYSHVTCATDTRNIQYVFDATVDVILTANRKDVGMM